MQDIDTLMYFGMWEQLFQRVCPTGKAPQNIRMRVADVLFLESVTGMPNDRYYTASQKLKKVPKSALGTLEEELNTMRMRAVGASSNSKRLFALHFCVKGHAIKFFNLKEFDELAARLLKGEVRSIPRIVQVFEPSRTAYVGCLIQPGISEFSTEAEVYESPMSFFFRMQRC